MSKKKDGYLTYWICTLKIFIFNPVKFSKTNLNTKKKRQFFHRIAQL